MEGISSEEHEATIDLREYWAVVAKRRWTVISFFLVVVLLVTIFSLRQTKIYQAQASLIIEPDAPQVLGVNEVYNLGARSYWTDQQYYNTQLDVIASRTVSQKVVQLLRLEGNKEFLGITELPIEEQQLWLEEPLDYVEMVQEMIEVELGKDSRTAYVRAHHPSPIWAQRIANATINAYIEYNSQIRQQVSQDAAAWLASQSNELKNRMNEAENQLVDFKKKNNILSVSLENQQNITSQKLMDRNRTLNQLTDEIEALKAEMTLIKDVKDQRLPLDSLEKVIDNPQIQRLKEDFYRLKTQLVELQSKYLPDHPQVKAAEKKMKEKGEDVRLEIDKLLFSVENKYKKKMANEQALQRELDKIKNEAQALNEKEIEYNRLTRIVDNYSSLYSLVLKRQKEATLASHQETNNVYKLDSAVEPILPVHPRVKLNLFLAVMLGLLGGIGLVFFLEYLDNTIKTQQDVQKYLNISFLGIIPTIRLDEDSEKGSGVALRDHYLIRHPKSPVAECCRTVRTNILFMSPEKSSKRLLVTSAGPEEGKSTVVVNLGVTMAQSGSRILLLDTDMRRPRLHKTFGVSSDSGLTTAILGEIEAESVIHHSEVPGLDLIPCGPIPPNPTELIHTERFSHIVEQLSSRYDRILFDSPPVLVVADPMILSRMMDGVVLVIKGAHTSRDMIGRAVRQLSDVKARILGAVINDLDLSNKQYGYYYYRQYGYYYGEKERDAPA